jgi:multisubunit Na+/H+ antiporter MnhC subunit
VLIGDIVEVVAAVVAAIAAFLIASPVVGIEISIGISLLLVAVFLAYLAQGLVTRVRLPRPRLPGTVKRDAA